MASALAIPFCFKLVALDFEFSMNPQCIEEDLKSFVLLGMWIWIPENFGSVMFLLYHFCWCNIHGRVFHECYANDLSNITWSGVQGHYMPARLEHLCERALLVQALGDR
jgi:hypothetical protein